MENIDLKILASKFTDHCASNERDSARATAERKAIRLMIDQIKNNHLEHIQRDLTELKVGQGKHGEQIGFLTKGFWLLFGIGITTLLGIVVNTYLNLN